MYVRIRVFERVALILCLAVLLATGATFAQKPGKNGTTLAAVKTIEICEQADGSWLYSGEVAAWNEGAIATSGLAIQDCIQNKTDSGQFADVYCTNLAVSEIPAGTTEGTATTFSYNFVGAPLTGDIRNVARLTILNHSGSIGTPKGPEPKATWLGEVGPCAVACTCTFSQGYYKTHPEAWPAGFDPNALFFLSGNTWQFYLDHPGGNGYNILAVQYIAAVLNQAGGSCVPPGIADLVNQAAAWLSVNGPGACPSPSSCGVQKDWGAILATYNLGTYPDSPGHCGG